MSDQNELIAQFISTTGAEVDKAQSFLENNNWNLERAVDQFFDNPNQADDEPAQRRETEEPLGTTATASSSTKRSAPPKSNKIRTLRDIDSDQNDEEHENLYAGGEKSGMAVQDPSKRRGAPGSSSGNNLVDEILKKASEGGPTEEKPAEEKKPTYYTGSGYRLGSEDEPSTLAQPSPQVEVEEEDTEPVTRYLTFWRNGFSVDDGPLFLYTDPANQEMLTAINSGRAPLSLLNVRHGQPVEVRVVKRQEDDYKPPPKAPPKPFEGTGNRLGSDVSASSSPLATAPGAFPTSNDTSNNTADIPTVDESQPITTIQIRLGDGTKKVRKFNHTHTVEDIRSYIDTQAPTGRSYILQTTFPVKELDDKSTIKDAGLLNSVIVQRYQ